jgi:hypothetical protein
MGQSVSNLANAAMRVYDKVVHDQVFQKNVLFMNILRNVAQEIGATTKYISLHYDRNVGSAAGSETVVLPIAGNQQYLQANVTMKYNFHTVSITDVAIKASARSKEFLVNVLESEYQGAKNDMQRQLSRQGYGIGTGVICRVNGTPSQGATSTVTLDTPMIGKYPTDYISIGNGLMFSSAAAAETSAVFGTVSSIPSNTTLVFSDATGVADDDYVFLAHTNGSTPTVSNLNAEMMGLKGLIDDGANIDSFQGLARTTYKWWQSYVDDASTQRSLTDALLHSTFLEAKKKGDPKYILTSFDVTSAYGQLLTPDRRYGVELKLEGGFSGVGFNGIPMVADFDAPYDEAYFIDPSTLSVEDLAPMSFLQEDGAILNRSSTQPIWNATLRYYANLANSAPNQSSALRDIVK